MSEDEEGYYEYYELSGSDDSEEHIYCEIQDLEVLMLYLSSYQSQLVHVSC
jgi:hypothetical protein